MERFRIRTIVDPNPDLFLNNGSNFRSNFDLEPVLLSPKPGPLRGLESSFKIDSNFLFFLNKHII